MEDYPAFFERDQDELIKRQVFLDLPGVFCLESKALPTSGRFAHWIFENASELPDDASEEFRHLLGVRSDLEQEMEPEHEHELITIVQLASISTEAGSDGFLCDDLELVRQTFRYFEEQLKMQHYDFVQCSSCRNWRWFPRSLRSLCKQQGHHE